MAGLDDINIKVDINAVPPKVKFDTGAERGSEATTGYYMLSQIALRRYANAMAEGATKYKPFNYLLGIPVINLWDHMMTHLALFLQGDATEDHLGHAFWNLVTILQFSETRLDLFDGLPPGVKDAMIEFPQHTDEGSNRPDTVPFSAGPHPYFTASSLDSGGNEESCIHEAKRFNRITAKWLEEQNRNSSMWDAEKKEYELDRDRSHCTHRQGWEAAVAYLIKICKDKS
jgi:hypothetical protein